MTLGPGLTVSRIQEIFGYSHLHFAPGSQFSTNVDLLTHYRPQLLSLISEDFYSPKLLKPRLEDRVTTRVSDKQKIDDLPHLFEHQMKWATIHGSCLLEAAPMDSNPAKGYGSTGGELFPRNKSVWDPAFRVVSQMKKTCHPHNHKLLLAAQNKLNAKKNTNMTAATAA